jgi:predicted nucleic-acid-binding protein
MASLDTNVLVRWLVGDDPVQTAKVRRLLQNVKERQETLFVPTTVALELEWVLRSRYGYAKSDLLRTFNALLETYELEFQDEEALERALHLYRQGSADFADALHLGTVMATERAPFLTFDEKASRFDGAELLV